MIAETSWKGFDAGMRLATAAVDTLYRLPLSGQVLNSVAPLLLRRQRLSNAITGAAFAGLWQTVGLPTTADFRALRDELSFLAADVRAQRRENQVLTGLATRILQTLEAGRPLTMTADGVDSRVMDQRQFKSTITSTSSQRGN